MAQKRSLISRLLSPARRGRRAFARDETGAVAIEFAFLGPIFFALIYAILETSIAFLAGQILDSAVHDASRRIRTDQPEAATAELFRADVCEGLYGMFDCSKLKVRVEVLDNFSSAAVVTPISTDPECDPEEDEDECWTIEEAYDGGGRNNVVLVQVFYRWPTIVNIPGVDILTLANGSRLLSAVRLFMNEPF
jgi:Flp pilus assembly protein TadG